MNGERERREEEGEGRDRERREDEDEAVEKQGFICNYIWKIKFN